MSRLLLFLAGLAIILGAGLVHGVWTERWQPRRELQDAVARLQNLPGNLGPWKQSPAKLDPEALRQAEAVGHWSKEYTHEGGGNTVLVILLCGRPGPMSVHRPEHCYSGAGFEMTAPPFPYEVLAEDGSRLAQCWSAKFRQQDAADPTRLRIFWTWFAGGSWQAPESPRFVFAGNPALYKLYVVRVMTAAQERFEEDPCLDFLRRLLPALTQALTPP
jgi:hypothetical protein